MSKKSGRNCDHNRSQDFHLYGHLLYKLTDKSFEMEMDRYSSLGNTASRLLTCISILLPATITLIGIIYPTFVAQGHVNLLVVFALFELAALLASFIIGLFSQFRFRYKALASPSSFAKSVGEKDEDIQDERSEAMAYAQRVGECYDTLVKRNNKIQKLVGATSALLIAAACILLLFGAHSLLLLHF